MQCHMLPFQRFFFILVRIDNYVDLNSQDDITPQEYMSMAQQAHSMGIPIDVDEFRRVTGLSFIKSSSEGEIVWTPDTNQ